MPQERIVVVRALSTCNYCHSKVVAWVRTGPQRVRLVEAKQDGIRVMAYPDKIHMCAEAYRDVRHKDN